MNAVSNLRARIATTKAPALLSGNDGVARASKDMVQVEPKTYFANERTFIQWISAALLLLTVSSIMMGNGNYNGTSSVIAFSALVLVTYASYVYFRRVNLLRSGEAYGYLDFLGPSILAAGVGLGVFIVFADAVKGSDLMPFGNDKDNGKKYYKDYDDRRFLMGAIPLPQTISEVHVTSSKFEGLQEVEGVCLSHSIEGVSMLEYQPRDILLTRQGDISSDIIVATPQALISQSLAFGGYDEPTNVLATVPDAEIQSVTIVGDRILALSTGPIKTELIEFDTSAAIHTRLVVEDTPSHSGSMVFVPSEDQGRIYIYLDGNMHTYELSSNLSPSLLSRTGSINMKVLNRGNMEKENPIRAMDHFEGISYFLRHSTLEAWDLDHATLLQEMKLPSTMHRGDEDHWAGIVFERRSEEEAGVIGSNVRKRITTANKTSVYAHMPLDTFPPQLWSFRMEEGKGEDHSVFEFPTCVGVN